MHTIARESRLHRAFCTNVRARRSQLGLTQVEVAAEMGVSQPTYAAIEAGRRVPSLVVVEAVANALDTTAARLMAIPKKLPTAY